MKQERTLKKNELMFSDLLGVCQVTEIINLSNKKGETILYYRLQSIINKNTFSYIPAHGHQMKLRDVISIDKAKAKKAKVGFSNLPDIERQEIEYVLSCQK